jgi:tetratricopeptide (TPR) repeat protein
LKARAKELPDITMNDLVILGIRNVLEGAELTVVTDSEMTDARTDLVVSAIGGEVGAVKGAAQHFVNLGRANLASLLYWMSAEMIARDDPKQAAKELIRSADSTPRQSRPIAIALLRAALRHNPSSEVAKNRLGQFLYFEGDYAGAVEHLASVRERDNHAKLFHGWASLELATAQENRAAATRAREEIVNALEAWAFGERDPRSRSSWLKQVAKLAGKGPDYRQTVEELIAYANDNTSWNPISTTEVADTDEGADDNEIADLGTRPAPIR